MYVADIETWTSPRISSAQRESSTACVSFAMRHFKCVGIEQEFQGEGIDEKGIDKATGKVLVEVSPDFFRLTEVVNLWGDPTKAKAELGWNPEKTSFQELVKLMVDSDMAKVAIEDAGQKVRTNLAEYLEKGIVK